MNKLLYCKITLTPGCLKTILIFHPSLSAALCSTTQLTQKSCFNTDVIDW